MSQLLIFPAMSRDDKAAAWRAADRAGFRVNPKTGKSDPFAEFARDVYRSIQRGEGNNFPPDSAA